MVLHAFDVTRFIAFLALNLVCALLDASITMGDNEAGKKTQRDRLCRVCDE